MNALRKWLNGFRYAYDGLKYSLATQRNLKFHFFAAFVVLIAALYLHLTKMEILFLLLSITLVIVTELVNTAIEKAVDLASPGIHPLAKIAKDVAAASVLVTAAFAAVTGMIVFYDPIDRYFLRLRQTVSPFSPGGVWVLLSLVLLAVIVMGSRFSGKARRVRPSLLTAFAFSVSTLITLMTWVTLVFLLSFSLAFLVMLILYEKQNRGALSLVLGALAGIAATTAACFLAGL